MDLVRLAGGKLTRRMHWGSEPVAQSMTPTGARISRNGMLLILASLVAVVLVVALIGRQSPERPGKGISRSDAITLAWQREGSDAVAVSSAEIRHDFNPGFNLPTHRWAWVVTFSGQWHLLCSGHSTDGRLRPDIPMGSHRLRHRRVDRFAVRISRWTVAATSFRADQTLDGAGNLDRPTMIACRGVSCSTSGMF